MKPYILLSVLFSYTWPFSLSEFEFFVHHQVAYSLIGRTKCHIPIVVVIINDKESCLPAFCFLSTWGVWLSLEKEKGPGSH